MSKLTHALEWMYGAITHPLGVPAGVESREQISAMVTSSATLTSKQRLNIYHRSYFARLLECMDEMFPALRHALGNDLFRGFALSYLHAHPPESYTLGHLADRFPEYLASTRPVGEPMGEQETWPDFLIELATLEIAYQQIFDGPGVEGQRIAETSQVLALSPYKIIARPVPSMRLFSFRYPVHTYLLAYRKNMAPSLPDPHPCCVGVTRSDYRVRIFQLFRPQYNFLQRLNGSVSLGTLSQSLPEVSPSTLTDWMCEWVSQGLILSITQST